MADPDRGESQDSGHPNLGAEGTGTGSSPESTSAGDLSAETDDFQSIIDALAPIESWSSSTVSSLKAAVNDKYPEAVWHEESEWTERAINAILSTNQGWDWQRLKRCSNAEYFSLPIHTIALLNDLFYSHAFEKVDARVEEGDYDAPLDPIPEPGMHETGYPIFRVDYRNDEQFQLYKLCWDRFLEQKFYRAEAVDREDIKWYWVEDRLRLDGKGPREVQRVCQTLKGRAFPMPLATRWFCLMVDRGAIESMLRVYGPPATRIFNAFASDSSEMDVPFLPYVVAVSTSSTQFETEDEGTYHQREDGPDDGKYRGYFKVALRSIFTFWESEQIQSPQEYYTGRDSIWGDTLARYRISKS